jgi:hypothetical protein
LPSLAAPMPVLKADPPPKPRRERKVKADAPKADRLARYLWPTPPRKGAPP